MNNAVLVLGESGSGKSTSIRNLPPEETFIINVVDKPLPFKGGQKKYIKASSDLMLGNYYKSDDSSTIIRAIKAINAKRQDIKYLIIDDMGYILMNEFMSKALIKGYDKYSELAKNFHELINTIGQIRDDLFCFVMMHVEIDTHGKTRPKTVGKMIDQYICIEGRFTYVLHALSSDGKYKFVTNDDGQHMAKTPMGLFDKLTIDNDLLLVANAIYSYINEDINL
jgi:hypothetical protein